MKKILWILLPLILVGCSCSVSSSSSASSSTSESSPTTKLVYDVKCYSAGVLVLEDTINKRPRGDRYFYWNDEETGGTIETTVSIGCVSVPRTVDVEFEKPFTPESEFSDSEFSQEIIINP